MNILNGGKHSDNNISSQEFMIMPTSGKDFAENLQMGVETYHNLKKVLKSKRIFCCCRRMKEDLLQTCKVKKKH